MEAVNRESYVPAAPSLGSSGAGVADRLDAFAEGATPDALSGLADDLLAVAGLLGREPGLRRALSDPARGGDDRVELLRSLLRGKVGDQALELLEALVSARWKGPNALRDAVERLGVDALLAGAGRAGELALVLLEQRLRFGLPLLGPLDPTLDRVDPRPEHLLHAWEDELGQDVQQHEERDDPDDQFLPQRDDRVRGVRGENTHRILLSTGDGGVRAGPAR